MRKLILALIASVFLALAPSTTRASQPLTLTVSLTNFDTISRSITITTTRSGGSAGDVKNVYTDLSCYDSQGFFVEGFIYPISFTKGWVVGTTNFTYNNRCYSFKAFDRAGDIFTPLSNVLEWTL